MFGILSLAAYYTLWTPLPSKEKLGLGKKEEPLLLGFDPSTEKILITLGGTSVVVATEILRTRPVGILALGDQAVVTAHVEGDKLYTDVTIYGGADLKTVELKRNQFLVRPANWDYNFSRNAFEVVDENRKPVFQLYYKTPSHIVINGVFPNPKDGVMYLSEYGMFGDEPSLYFVRPIFNYPAFRFPGEYSDAPEINAEKVKQQIEKRLKEQVDEAEQRRLERQRQARKAVGKQ
jgi:hypothetical protein